MVPNAWLTRKWCFLEHLNFIITFSMNSLKYARAIHPYEMLLKYWRSELPFLGLWVEPSSCFYEKRFIKSSWNMEVTVLQNWGKRWIESHHCFIYCQTYLGLLMSLLLPVSLWQRCHGPCWKSKLIQPHILRKNSQYFNCTSFAYIHAFHWLHCSLHSFLEK